MNRASRQRRTDWVILASFHGRVDLPGQNQHTPHKAFDMPWKLRAPNESTGLLSIGRCDGVIACPLSPSTRRLRCRGRQKKSFNADISGLSYLEHTLPLDALYMLISASRKITLDFFLLKLKIIIQAPSCYVFARQHERNPMYLTIISYDLISNS